ncbi:hypothetical protein V8E53_003667 [Lactarius tabidus]
MTREQNVDLVNAAIGNGEVSPNVPGSNFTLHGMHFSYNDELTRPSYHPVHMDAIEGGTILAEQRATPQRLSDSPSRVPLCLRVPLSHARVCDGVFQSVQRLAPVLVLIRNNRDRTRRMRTYLSNTKRQDFII